MGHDIYCRLQRKADVESLLYLHDRVSWSQVASETCMMCCIENNVAWFWKIALHVECDVDGKYWRSCKLVSEWTPWLRCRRSMRFPSQAEDVNSGLWYAVMMFTF